ncbi:MAG: CofH family radical SAM protein [Cyanobacteria bacterium REEB446]|nr:CofH family radical SAM protein [Cyanobacteria bacterium REEB446]
MPNKPLFNSSATFFVEQVALDKSSEFSEIAEKLIAAERLSLEDGYKIIRSNDIVVLGQLANFVRQRKAYEVALRKGFNENIALEQTKTVWWNTNLHLNPTNICIASCDFCSFARKPKEEGAYTMSIDEAVHRVIMAREEGATEVHIVGGLNPKCLIEYYSELICAIKQAVPAIHVKAFTAVEIDFFKKFEKDMSYEDIFNRLIEAGLDSMPGGGAEIFSRAVRDEMCPDKISADKWVEIHQLAHRKGLKTNATMLAGIGEEPEERIDHLDILRKAQDISLAAKNPQEGSFQTFIPLSCHYEGNDLLERGVKPITGQDQIKNIIASRLILDNFDHIKAYWIQLGEKTAQVALSMGANDLDGTVKAERITFAAGAKQRSMAETTLVNIIEGARLIPRERDTLYNPIELSLHRV